MSNNSLKLGQIAGVSVVGDAVLFLTWSNGPSARVDLTNIIVNCSALAPLAEPDMFSGVALSGDGWSIEWPCGIDFGAPQLRRWADEQSGDAFV